MGGGGGATGGLRVPPPIQKRNRGQISGAQSQQECGDTSSQPTETDHAVYQVQEQGRRDL